MTYYVFICNTYVDKSYFTLEKTKIMISNLIKKISSSIDLVHTKLLDDKTLVRSYIDDTSSPSGRMRVLCSENFINDLKMVWLSSLLNEYMMPLYLANAVGHQGSVVLVATEANILVTIKGPKNEYSKNSFGVTMEEDILGAIQAYELAVRELLERELF
ncbi:MAG: hypothetical protein WCG55_03770 [bacterium]